MYLESIGLYCFRNFADLQLRPGPFCNFVIGRNGQGKTNFIEAINLLSTSRSFRTSCIKEMISWERDAGSVSAVLKQAHQDLDLRLVLSRSKREAFINGDLIKSAADFIGKLTCVVFTPTDLSLVKGAPEGRRRFIDRHAADLKPALINDLLEYNRALKNKNTLLKQGESDLNILRSWNEIMARTAVRISEGRKEFLSEIEKRANQYHPEFCTGDGELMLKLKSSLHCAEGRLNVSSVMDELEKNLPQEITYRTSLKGPHRDDILIFLGGRAARAFASQGQARSIVLSLKLAAIALIEEKKQEPPVVLLDDVDSELDQGRARNFFSLLSGQQRQVFITGTEAALASMETGAESVVIEIADGSLSRAVNALVT